MALNDLDALYGFNLPSSTYDDSASPNSDNEDSFNTEADALAQSGANESGDGEQKRKGRRPPSTAERRATHNAVERARRESLNGRFMELAAALPSMASVKRPSKSAIVLKSLEYVYQTEDREKALRDENASLRKEVEELRAKLGLAPVATTAPIAIIPSGSPRTGGRERFGSFDESANSVVSCSPASSGASFETSPMTNVQALNSSNSAYNAAFARAMMPTNSDLIQPPTPTADASNLLKQPTAASLPVSAMPFHMGLPAAVHPLAAYDSNYLMAFTMQQQQQHQAAVQHQQQQQNALNLMSGGMNNWSAYNFLHGMNHPMSASMPDYSANLAFA